jgi:hypothetical protein
MDDHARRRRQLADLTALEQSREGGVESPAPHIVPAQRHVLVEAQCDW